MAGNYRIYYCYRNEEHSLVSWLELDNPTVSDKEVIAAVMDDVPNHVAPTILRLVDLDSNGKPMLYDEFLITDSKGIVYGLVFQKVGYDGWYYLPDYSDFERRPGQRVTDNSFMIPGAAGYTLPNTNNFPAAATINWDRLSVLCNGDEFYLVPWPPLP